MQAGVSGRARSPLRAASRPERLARECEPYQMADAGRRLVVKRTKQNSRRFLSNSLKLTQHRSSLMNRDLRPNPIDGEFDTGRRHDTARESGTIIARHRHFRVSATRGFSTAPACEQINVPIHIDPNITRLEGD